MERTTLRASRLIAGIVVGGGVFAAFAWLASSSREAGVVPLAAEPAAPVEPLQVTLPSAATKAARDDAAEAALPIATRSALEEGKAVDSSEPDGFLVEVVDAASGRPCGGARVLAFWGSDARHLGPALVDDARLAAESSAAYRANEEGRARIRPRTPDDWLLALHGNAWGLVRLDAQGPSPLRVAVAPRETLAVEVLDARGAPATGIRLEVGKLRAGDGSARQLIGRFNGIVTSTSDARGRARFAGVEFLPPLVPDGELTVVATPPLAAPVAVAVPPREQRGGPLRVTLPATGTLQVRLVDGSGEIVPIDASLRVMTSEASPIHGAHESWLTAGMSPSIAVGLGGQVTAVVSRPAHARVEATRDGPAREGEAVVLDVVASVATIPVHGKAVREDGTPWTGALKVRWWIPTEQRGSWDGALCATSSNSDGRFVAEVAEAAFEHGPPSVTLSAEDDGFLRMSRRITLPELLRQESIDLDEEIVLPGPEAIVEGVIVGGDGMPIAGAHVRTNRRRRPDDDPLDFIYGNDASQESGRDGRFRFFARRSDDEIDIDVMRTINGWRAYASARWKGGEREMRIVLVAQGAIMARAELPDDVPTSAIEVRVQLAKWRGAEKPGGYNSRSPVRGEEFRVDVGAGVYDVVVRTRSDPLPLLEVRDVVVEPGQVTRDPRLLPVDLRGLLQRTRLTILDPDGATVRDGSVSLRPAGSSDAPSEQRQLEGKPIEIVTRSPLDLVIQARGCRSRVERGVGGDRTIQLERGVGVAVKLRFHKLPPLEGSQRWWVRLHALDVPLDRGDWPLAQLDTNGECTFTVEDGGSHEFLLQRDLELPGLRPAQSVPIDPGEFTIPASPTEPTLELDIDVIE